MLHLIEKLVPASVHRALLPTVHKLRHRWRKWRGVPLAGVSVVLVNPAGEILLLRHSYGPKVWALPGGGLGANEVASDAAIREVEEELGIALDAVQELGTLKEEISGSPHTAYLFSAVCDLEPKPDGREVIEAHFFPVDALPTPLGRLTQARIDAWKDRSTGGDSQQG